MNRSNNAFPVVAAFLGLHVLLVFLDPVCAWGVNQLRYFSSFGVLVAVAASALILVPGSQAWAMNHISRFSVNPWRSESEFRIFVIGSMVVSLILFGLFRSSIHLLGDGYLLLRDLAYFDPEISWKGINAPLVYWTVKKFHILGESIWESPVVTYRLYSMICGAAYFGLSPVAARVLGKTGVERTIILGFLLSAGLIELFYGYVETYALLIPATLLYLVLGIQSIQGTRSLLLPSLVLGFLMAMHFAMVSLVPSLLILAWVRMKVHSGEVEDVGKMRYLLAHFGPTLLTPAVTILVLGIIGFDPVNYLSSSKGTHLLPFTGALTFHQHYRLFSLEHFSDVLNQYLLIAPAAVMGIAFLGRRVFRMGDEPVYLMVATLVPFLFSFLANPEVGAFRDWDVFAFPGLPMTLWVAVMFCGAFQDTERLKQAGFVIVSAALVHTGLWVGVNARMGRAEARYSDVMTRGFLSGNARSYGWETYAIYQRESGKNEEAIHAYDRAIEASPDNPRHWIALGNRYLELDRFQDAIDALKKGFELAPAYSETYAKNLANAHGSLGNVYYRLGKFQEAIAQYTLSVKTNPEHVDMLFNLGVAYSESGDYVSAIRNYKKVVSLSPGYGLAYLNMGNSYSDLKDVPNAVVQYQKALEIDPEYTNAHYNLALAYLELGDAKKARDGFLKVLDLDDDYQKAEAIQTWLAQHPK